MSALEQYVKKLKPPTRAIKVDGGELEESSHGSRGESKVDQGYVSTRHTSGIRQLILDQSGPVQLIFRHLQSKVLGPPVFEATLWRSLLTRACTYN